MTQYQELYDNLMERIHRFNAFYYARPKVMYLGLIEVSLLEDAGIFQHEKGSIFAGIEVIQVQKDNHIAMGALRE